ncbi:MAG: NHL repeat-containing protein, partial [Phycisphaerae bacterium]|nr:NHL repeat-containing protein [Phycisphaerae bacterium]
IQARVEIAVNGGEFFTLKTFLSSVNCTTETIDLSDYANSIIQLRWFMAVIGISSYATNAYGWVVDDVKVIGGFDSSVETPNPDQRLYVADTRNHRISIWKYTTGSDAVGNPANFGQYGDGNGQFNRPEDVAVGPNGYIYIADTGNHRIQVFDKDGAYQGQFGSYGDGNGKFNSLSGLAVSGWVLKAGTNPLGPDRVADFFYLYVADTLNHRLQRFKISKNQPTTFTHDGNMGSYGDADGKFNLPEGTDADPIDTPAFLVPKMFQLPIVPEQWVGHVYVADQKNHRVQYFELTGAFTDKWGTYGDADTQFHQPQDVAVGIRLEDPIKNKSQRFVDVYVADTGNHQVKQYDDTGAHQDTIGSYGDADGKFNSPNGIAVDRLPQQLSQSDYPQSVGVDGDLFVIDSLNHRGQRFERTAP